eukprot:SAG22_NODE_161_length_16908_cov_39.687965_12_plen_186_part_00
MLRQHDRRGVVVVGQLALRKLAGKCGPFLQDHEATSRPCRHRRRRHCCRRCGVRPTGTTATATAASGAFTTSGAFGAALLAPQDGVGRDQALAQFLQRRRVSRGMRQHNRALRLGQDPGLPQAVLDQRRPQVRAPAELLLDGRVAAAVCGRMLDVPAQLLGPYARPLRACSRGSSGRFSKGHRNG